MRTVIAPIRKFMCMELESYVRTMNRCGLFVTGYGKGLDLDSEREAIKCDGWMGASFDDTTDSTRKWLIDLVILPN